MRPKTQVRKFYKINLTSSKVKTFMLQRTLLRKRKENSQNRRNYLQIIYLIRDLYPEYIKKSYNSTIKRQLNFKMGKGFV